MKQACRKVGAFYIGVHARMQRTDACQAILKLLRVASSGTWRIIPVGKWLIITMVSKSPK